MLPMCIANESILALDLLAVKGQAIVDNAGLWLWLAVMDGNRACVLGMMVEV